MSNTVINTNISALNSHRSLLNVGRRQARASERLSSGQRINRAADDAAGMAVSEKMRSQIRGLDQAERNSRDGISLIQVAEGAMQEIQDITQRIRELTVQAANDTLNMQDRDAIQLEIDELAEELSTIIERTEFNGRVLLDGGASSGEAFTISMREICMGVGGDLGPAPPEWGDIEEWCTSEGGCGGTCHSAENGMDRETLESWILDREDLQRHPELLERIIQEMLYPAGSENCSERIWTTELDSHDIHIQNGANAGQSLPIPLPNFNLYSGTRSPLVELINSAEDLILGTHVDITERLDLIDSALGDVSRHRAMLGAMQNRLEHTVNNLQIASENTSAAESRIRDTDMAKEMMNLTKVNILQQAAVSILAQANQTPQNILQLLQ